MRLKQTESWSGGARNRRGSQWWWRDEGNMHSPQTAALEGYSLIYSIKARRVVDRFACDFVWGSDGVYKLLDIVTF